MATEERIKENVAARAGDLVRQGYHWAEAVVLAVGGHVLSDLDPQCVRMTTGFAGGVGGTHQEMCGALSGGVLVIGALLGRATLDESDQAALALATDYRERFRADFGHTVCAQIREIVHAPGGLGSCAVLVQQAAIMLLEMLEER